MLQRQQFVQFSFLGVKTQPEGREPPPPRGPGTSDEVAHNFFRSKPEKFFCILRRLA